MSGERDIETRVADAVEAWRRELEREARFAAEQLDELEDHVRSSALALAAGNLSAEEQVWLAARRLGATAELEREFARCDRSSSFATNPAATLMLGASLGVLFLELVYFASRVAAETLAAPMGTAAWTSLAIFLLPSAAVAWFLARRAITREGALAWLDGSPRRAFRVAAWMILAIASLSFAERALSGFEASSRSLVPGDPLLSWVVATGLVVSPSLLLAALASFVVHRARERAA